MNIAEPFPLAIDHVYIVVSPDAPEAACLQTKGLRFLNELMYHQGQGTASYVCMFKNMYLELGWVRDRQEVLQQSEKVGTEIILVDPWQETGASPFGVGFHYTSANQSIPLVTKKHRAEWIPSSARIDVIPKDSIHEPAYFILSDELKHIEPPEAERSHALGLQNLTDILITVTNNAHMSMPTQFFATHSRLRIQEGPKPLMELTFDEGLTGESIDCHHILPLTIHY